MSKKQTPMMEQYNAIKEKYEDAFLFFRLGDFYELFNEDAVEASRILEITLTTRNKNAENPIPMCGVPYHSATEYIKKLIQEGHKVAICEQVEDPKLTKGMVKREVVRVVTPGTILEDDAVASKDNNYLAFLHRGEEAFVLVYGDLSTGEIHLTNAKTEKPILNEIQAIGPSEILLDDSLTEEQEGILKETMPVYFSDISHFDNKQITTWELKDATADEARALSLFVQYIESVQFQAIQHLQPVQRYQIQDYLQMNHYAKAQLELTKSLRTQKKKGSLLWLLDQTKTAMGGRLLQQWLEKPLMDVVELKQRHERVALLKDAYFERVDLLERMKKIYDLERLVTKISLKSANARDIQQLKQSLEQIPVINSILEIIESNNTSSQRYFEELNTLTPLYELISQALVDEPPISITEGDIIRDGFDETLDHYRDALRNGQQWLADLQQSERERTGLKTLKVGYNKVFGYYIEISRLQAAEFDDPRYERKQTLANSERYITEELKEIETTILEAQEKAANLEYELFVQIREQVNTYDEALQKLAKDVAALDVLCNFAVISEQENYVQASITDNKHQLKLVNSRHPVVEKLIGQSEFVPNDLTITPKQYLLILTGPNMSGKSTFMRQVAYAIILNQIGCFIPADEAVLPIVDRIFTRIGSSDDISIGQSTFMVEMMETNFALQEATSRSLLLFDEIGRGTATYDGMALAQGIIEYTAKHVQAITIFSTHYHELTDLAEQIPIIKNIHVGATEQDGELIFLHQILEGAADKSYGIHVAKLAGLPAELIVNSQQILNELESKNREPIKDQQLSLFEPEMEVQETSANEQLIEKIRSININQLTPIDALNYLNDLVNSIDE